MGLTNWLPGSGTMGYRDEPHPFDEIDRRNKLVVILMIASVATLILGMIAKDVPVLKEALVMLAVILMTAGIWQLIKLDRLRDKHSAR